MPVIKLRYVKGGEVIEMWMLAAVIEATRRGWFPKMHAPTERGRSHIHQEVNEAISFLVSGVWKETPERFELED